MQLLEGTGLDEPTAQIVLQDVTILLMKTGGKEELMTNMLKMLAGKFLELELEEESFNLGCQYLHLVAAIADAKLVHSFVDQFLDMTLAKIAANPSREERSDKYELLQKSLIDTMATVLVLKDENEALQSMLIKLCQSPGYIEALLSCIEGNCQERTAVFTGLCLTHPVIKAGIQAHFTAKSTEGGEGMAKIQSGMASLGLEKDVLAAYIASEVECRAGEQTCLCLQHMMDLNTEEDEALFFECWSQVDSTG